MFGEALNFPASWNDLTIYFDDIDNYGLSGRAEDICGAEYRGVSISVTFVTVKYKCVKLKERLTEVQSVNMKAILLRETFNLKENM